MTQTFYTLEDLHRWNEIAPTLDPPARLAVIGDPIAHSRSPQMHNPALRACGIDAQYIRVQVPVGRVAEAFGLFAEHGFLGVNCTIPHKFEALAAMHEVDSLARQLGAVNTVVIRDGKLKGFNSDGPGFLRSVEESFGRRVNELKVLILGAGGGAGRAVAVQCALEGCAEVYLCNRTIDKLSGMTPELKASLAKVGEYDVIFRDAVVSVAPQSDDSAVLRKADFPGLDLLISAALKTKLRFVAWNDDALARVLTDVDLIVNATPLGMKADDAPLFDLRLLQPRHLVYDMVYASGRSTPLIATAQNVRAKTCDGLVLLLHQGAISFEHWFEQLAPIKVMREGLSGEME